MNNIFVVGTPLQLLAAYILSVQFFPKEINQLVLIHPQGDKIWHNSYSLKKMSTDPKVWRQIVSLGKWLHAEPIWRFPRQMRQMKKRLLVYGSIDQVFLGSDKIIQNQILVELLGCNHYARIEDGIWSYHNRDRRTLSKVWQYLRIKFFRFLGDVTGDLEYNFGGVGHGKAATADYLFKPQLLLRQSPNAICIGQDAVQKVMECLTKEMDNIPALADDKCLLYLGSTFVERKVISLEQEQDILGTVYYLAQSAGMTVVYKPHPREDSCKIDSYSKSFPKITFLRINDPIEVIYAKHQYLKFVLSICSSGLLYADLFSRDITPIGLFKVFPIDTSEEILKELMEKAGVTIPDSLNQLSDIFHKESVTGMSGELLP